MKVESYIREILEKGEGKKCNYQNGGCYGFYKLLKSKYPNAEPYYDGDHIITKVGNNYFDARGKLPIESLERYIPLSECHSKETIKRIFEQNGELDKD